MRQWNGLPIFIMGASGTSKEAKSMIDDINCINQTNVYDIIAFVDVMPGDEINGVSVIDEETFNEKLTDYMVAGVIIPFGLPKLKMKAFEKIMKYANIVFPNIIHPSATVSKGVTMGVGNVVAAGATISPDVAMGNFCLVNNNCNIGHDSVLDDFVVINPLAAVSGNIHIKRGALIGGHAAILQELIVGENTQIGLGAFVVKDVPDNTTVICVPAKVR